MHCMTLKFTLNLKAHRMRNNIPTLYILELVIKSAKISTTLFPYTWRGTASLHAFSVDIIRNISS